MPRRTLIFVFLAFIVMLFSWPQKPFARGCITDGIACWRKANPCQKLHCAKNMERHINRSNYCSVSRKRQILTKVISIWQDDCDYVRGVQRVSFGNTADQLRRVNERLDGRVVRGPSLAQRAKVFFDRYSTFVTVSSGLVAALGAFLLGVSVFWIAAAGLAGVIGSYFTPDMITFVQLMGGL